MPGPIPSTSGNGGLDNLPQPLAVLKCRCGDGIAPGGYVGAETTYYILGTAHVSTQSCTDTAALIQAVKPDVVMLELCIGGCCRRAQRRVCGASSSGRAAACLASVWPARCACLVHQRLPPPAAVGGLE